MKLNRIAGLVALVFIFSWATSSARAQAPQESWPQKFQILQGDHATFGFALTQPGPISVAVQSQGAPITIALRGPLTQNVSQTGTGILHLSYMATQADVQRSALWLVYIAGGSNAPLPLPARPQVLASGIISVQHPPADLKIVQAQLNQLMALDKQKVLGSLNAQQSAETRALQERKARMQNASFATAAHLSVASTASLPASSLTAIRTPITVASSSVATAASSGAKTCTSLPGFAGKPGGIPNTQVYANEGCISAGTGSSSGSGSGGSGSSGTSTTPPVNAYDAVNSTPASSALTITYNGIGNPNYSDTAPYEPQWCSGGTCSFLAQAGDWVELSGPIQPGDEVHVIVGPTTDIALGTMLLSPSYMQGINYYSGGYIPSNITSPFQGWVYLKRGTQHGSLLPLLIEPLLDSAYIAVSSGQYQIASTNSDWGFGVSTYAGAGGGPGAEYVERDGGSVAGTKGDDYFFMNQPLINGWFVASTDISCQADEGSGGGAYVNGGGPGTGNEQVTVHWWVDAQGYSTYAIRGITIMGPKGTSYH
ncbi:MAG TPA: hypothetical protein VEI73_16955 [Candidatus Acidoferrum sp.]|nr:hypothetical protein [Candidatus Acidoferrum sp.]